MPLILNSLCIGDRRIGCDCLGRLRGEVGCKIPDDLSLLADEMARDCPLPEISGSYQESDLYNECDRIGKLHDPQNHPQSSIVPDDRRRAQADIHGLAGHLEKVDDALAGLGLSPQSIRDHLRHESIVVIRPFTQKMLQAPDSKSPTSVSQGSTLAVLKLVTSASSFVLSAPTRSAKVATLLIVAPISAMPVAISLMFDVTSLEILRRSSIIV